MVAARAELDRALDFIREGDVLIVTKLDRLARSVRYLLDIVERVGKKGASLNVAVAGSLVLYRLAGLF